MIELKDSKEKVKEEIKSSIKEKYQNINNMVTGDVLANLAYSSMIMLYFMFFNIQYEAVSEIILTKFINISSIAFLSIAIITIEVAYRKDDNSTLLYGIEFLILAIFTLLIKHIPKLLECGTQTYILVGSYLFAIYYMLKSTIAYTKERQQELNQYIDIKEIVKEEPIKKVTQRKNKKGEEK